MNYCNNKYLTIEEELIFFLNSENDIKLIKFKQFMRHHIQQNQQLLMPSHSETIRSDAILPIVICSFLKPKHTIPILLAYTYNFFQNLATTTITTTKVSIPVVLIRRVWLSTPCFASRAAIARFLASASWRVPFPTRPPTAPTGPLFSGFCPPAFPCSSALRPIPLPAADRKWKRNLIRIEKQRNK